MESKLILIGSVTIAFLFGLLVGQNWRRSALTKAMSEAALVLRAVWGIISSYLKEKSDADTILDFEAITEDESVLHEACLTVYRYLTDGVIPDNAPDPWKVEPGEVSDL